MCRYGIQAVIDEPLAELVRRRKIYEGLKLCINGADLQSAGPISPVEAMLTTSTVELSLSFNSVRRAKWHSKLGFQKMRTAYYGWRAISSAGGLVPRLDFFLWRCMPMS